MKEVIKIAKLQISVRRDRVPYLHNHCSNSNAQNILSYNRDELRITTRDSMRETNRAEEHIIVETYTRADITHNRR